MPSPADARTSPIVTWRSWLIWGIAALFYLTGFYQRVSPAVMTSELMRDFRLGAGSLGSLSAFYFYFYVAIQIPAGFLTDPGRLPVRLDFECRPGLCRPRHRRRRPRRRVAGAAEAGDPLVPGAPLRHA